MWCVWGVWCACDCVKRIEIFHFKLHASRGQTFVRLFLKKFASRTGTELKLKPKPKPRTEGQKLCRTTLKVTMQIFLRLTRVNTNRIPKADNRQPDSPATLSPPVKSLEVATKSIPCWSIAKLRHVPASRGIHSVCF